MIKSLIISFFNSLYRVNSFIKFQKDVGLVSYTPIGGVSPLPLN